MDPRPARGEVVRDSEGFITADSPSKGTETALGESIGVLPQQLHAYRKQLKFREAYRQALQDDIRDPKHMARALDRLNEIIATGEDKDALKAIEVLKGLSGFELKPEPLLRPASEMTDEELAAHPDAQAA